VTAVAVALDRVLVVDDDPLQVELVERGLSRDGFEVRGVRIVLYSAWEESRLRVLAGQLGADGFISKSDSVTAFGRRLRAMLAA
jgi:hypothetical protein